ncbi:MAG: ribonuclease H-like domain-containing protein [Acidobacteriota bacterium]|nr:ribonuclease H-like domain-containing protein [Acidobacteriota bacterium]
MDLDELREQLRKRTGHGQPDKVRELWKNIEARRDLTTKQKLEKLLALSRKKESGEKTASARYNAGVVPGTSHQPYLVLENNFNLNSSYGQIPISLGLNIPGQVLYILSRDEAFKTLSLSGSVFIDLETTGLAGGTGTVPFLIGLGFFDQQAFKVVQFFLNDLASEFKMLTELEELARDRKFTSVISYNGKGFDLPLLETRFTLNRQRCPLSDLPHLDFLFSARHLWKQKYESCRLYNLALAHLGADRAEDIPPEEIPWRYFQYLRSGEFSLVEPVLYHNQEDIMSLYGVVVAGGLAVGQSLENLEAEIDSLELFGLGKIWEKAGEKKKSAELYEKALDQKLPVELSVKVKKNLALYFKKCGLWEKSIKLWEDLCQNSEDVDCWRELAMYYEHQLGQPETALKFALDGLALSREISPALQKDFERRVGRLTKKINVTSSGQDKVGGNS